MSLANFLLRTALGNDRAPDRLEVALFNAGSEVKDPGYKRAVVGKGSWRILNEKANTTATFGPFRGTVVADRSVVFHGGSIVDEHPFDDQQPRAQMPAGFIVHIQVILDLTAK